MTNKKLFIASSVFIAYIDRTHQKHAQATAYFEYFATRQYQLYTSFLSVVEAYRTIFNDISPFLARDFLRAITLSSINVLYPSEADIKIAIKALVASQSKDLNFLDAQAETMAYRNSVTQIFSFDYVPLLFGITSFVLPI